MEVQAGDFMWLRAYCRMLVMRWTRRFRYLLYKDVNRHVSFGNGFPATCPRN